MPKRIAVTVVKIKNLSTGISEICAQRLTTRAVEQPIINKPPMISPQRMLLSSMKELSTSEKDLRGGRGLITTSSFTTGATETTAGVFATGAGRVTGAGAGALI